MHNDAGPATTLRWTKLARHPQSTGAGDCDIHVALASTGDTLDLSYRLRGDLAQLQLPPQSALRRGERLWQHSCFEVFVMSAAGAGYSEFNLAPTGAWDSYQFSDYRTPVAMSVSRTPPQIRTSRSQQRYCLRARLPCLAGMDAEAIASVRIGLSVILESVDGELSWWALRHTSDKPDFHDARSFLRLVDLLALAPVNNA